MSVLDEVQGEIARVAEAVGPAVVGVGGRRWGAGSGVVVGAGRVVTNAHNVRGSQITVTVGDRKADGRVEGVDADGDVAVLSVDTAGVEPVTWDPDTSVSLGAPVFALSNPGGRGLRVTFGFVSGTERSFRGPRGRRIMGSVEHTSPLLPGSSGGPIVDGAGRFLGLNTNRLGEGFYLAIPADGALKEKVDALARGESVERPRIGIGIAPGHVARGLRRAVGLPEADGLLVRLVEDDSPAARAGLQEGDLIVAAGGRTIGNVDDLYAALDALGSTGSIELTLLRGTDERTVTVSSSS